MFNIFISFKLSFNTLLCAVGLINPTDKIKKRFDISINTFNFIRCLDNSIIKSEDKIMLKKAALSPLKKLKIETI